MRLLACFLGGSVLLAVMTGSPGSTSAPTAGFKDSLDSPRVIGFLVFGVVAWSLLTTLRRAQSGEQSRLAVTGRAKGRALAAIWRRVLENSVARRAVGIVTLLIAALVAVLLADFTGPYALNKLSLGYLGHQFSFSFTYGYLMFALLLWALVSRRVLEQLGLRSSTPAPADRRRRTAVVVGCVLAALVFSLAANPWLPPRLHWSAFSVTAGSSSSIFWQWPTYLWLVASLLIARRLLGVGERASRRAAPTRRASFMTPQMTIVLTVAAVFVAVEWPKFLASYWQGDVTQQIGTYCLLALGLNVVVGFAGLLDLGYVAFYAVGAYTAAYFTGHLPVHPPFTLNMFAIIPIAIGAAMLAGVILGFPTLRVRGDYLAIVTLGFGEIIEVYLNNATPFTNGSQGTIGYLPPFSIHFLGINYSWNFPHNGQTKILAYYYLLLAFLALAIFVFSSINHSRVGRRWSAIREDEVAAASIGVNPLKYKVMAFAIGASTAGFAGIFTAANIGVLYPQSFVLQISILILALVIFGGMGSIVGVMVGAALFEFLLQYLQLHPFPGYLQQDYYMYIGALFIILMIYRPQGIIGSKRRAREFQLAEKGVGFADPTGAETSVVNEFEGSPLALEGPGTSSDR
jgi:branched-chain amino acid transport system permease protein